MLDLEILKKFPLVRRPGRVLYGKFIYFKWLRVCWVPLCWRAAVCAGTSGRSKPKKSGLASASKRRRSIDAAAVMDAGDPAPEADSPAGLSTTMNRQASESLSVLVSGRLSDDLLKSLKRQCRKETRIGARQIDEAVFQSAER